jgi:hypothetical protein
MHKRTPAPVSDLEADHLGRSSDPRRAVVVSGCCGEPAPGQVSHCRDGRHRARSRGRRRRCALERARSPRGGLSCALAGDRGGRTAGRHRRTDRASWSYAVRIHLRAIVAAIALLGRDFAPTQAELARARRTKADRFWWFDEKPEAAVYDESSMHRCCGTATSS